MRGNLVYYVSNEDTIVCSKVDEKSMLKVYFGEENRDIEDYDRYESHGPISIKSSHLIKSYQMEKMKSEYYITTDKHGSVLWRKHTPDSSGRKWNALAGSSNEYNWWVKITHKNSFTNIDSYVSRDDCELRPSSDSEVAAILLMAED